MIIQKILTQDRTQARLKLCSKKRVLCHLGQMLCDEDHEMNCTQVIERLVAREQLGSTAVGRGVALPHARVAGLTEVIGVLLQLKEPVDFDSDDEQGVDIIFAIFVPDEEDESHLKTLSELATLFRNPEFVAAVRESQDNEQLYFNALKYDD